MSTYLVVIDPNDNAKFSNLLSSQEDIKASATAKVDHYLTLAETSESDAERRQTDDGPCRDLQLR